MDRLEGIKERWLSWPRGVSNYHSYHRRPGPAARRSRRQLSHPVRSVNRRSPLHDRRSPGPKGPTTQSEVPATIIASLPLLFANSLPFFLSSLPLQSCRKATALPFHSSPAYQSIMLYNKLYTV